MVKTQTTIELISKKEFELIRITKDILKAVEESGVQNGVVYAITAHTTTGILVNESLACLEVDIERKLEELVPTFDSYNHNHFLPSYRRHRLQRAGPSEIHDLRQPLCRVPHCGRTLWLCGNAQDVYFGEFDGIQRRKVYITVMGE